MQTYHLADEFTDIAAEQALLASIIGTPTLYWDVLDLLTPEVFTKEADTWQAVALALEAGKSPHVPATGCRPPTPTSLHAASWTSTSDVYSRRCKSAWGKCFSMRPRPRRIW